MEEDFHLENLMKHSVTGIKSCDVIVAESRATFIAPLFSHDDISEIRTQKFQYVSCRLLDCFGFFELFSLR